MINGLLAVQLDWRSAITVIKAIEDPLGNVTHEDCLAYDEPVAEVCADKKAEELIDYIERGELVMPSHLRERTARAIIKFRLDRA